MGQPSQPRRDSDLRAFIEGELKPPQHLARVVHDHYLKRGSRNSRPRTLWRLPKAFTSAFKEPDPTPQPKATAKLGVFPPWVRSFKERLCVLTLLDHAAERIHHNPHARTILLDWRIELACQLRFQVIRAMAKVREKYPTPRT